METKKSPRADLQKKQPLFLQLGLLLALSTALFAFELRTFVSPPIVPPDGRGSTTLKEEILNTTREQPKPPDKVNIPVSMLMIVLSGDPTGPLSPTGNPPSLIRSPKTPPA